MLILGIHPANLFVKTHILGVSHTVLFRAIGVHQREKGTLL